MARCPSVDGAASSAPAAASSADKSITETTSPNLGDLPTRARRGSHWPRPGLKKDGRVSRAFQHSLVLAGGKLTLEVVGNQGRLSLCADSLGAGENFPALVMGAGGPRAPPTWEILVACLSIKLRLEKVGRERRGIKVEEKCGGSRK